MKQLRIYNGKLTIKYIILKICLLFFTLSIFNFQFYIPVSAHLVGQPPFLKINGQYANLYPVPLTSLYDFNLPQDLAPENYLVNQPINFELVSERLPAPPNIVAITKFDWDFADGSHGNGLLNTHKFTKIGSFIVNIYADDGTTPKPQLLESVLINVLPDKDYVLPQAKILANGKMSKDSLTDIIKADFNNSVSLDGSKSTNANKLTEFFWDFGDQKSSSGGKQTHKYTPDLSQIFVVLRVKDTNGFIADNYAEIQNIQAEKNGSASATTSTNTVQPQKPSNLPIFLSMGLASLVVIIFIARKFVQGQRRGRR